MNPAFYGPLAVVLGLAAIPVSLTGLLAQTMVGPRDSVWWRVGFAGVLALGLLLFVASILIDKGLHP